MKTAKQKRIKTPKSISQSEIEILLGLEELIWQRWDIYDGEAASVARRLMEGAAVEKGVHTVQIQRRVPRGRPTLLLDGAPALARMEDAIGRAKSKLLQERCPRWPPLS